ncbi:MAG: type II secretion system protein [Phycisphaerae bacterium]|nr:type II secretion system protein [Phycisphaerae bacterium]
MNKRRNAFTLIELLVVIAIIAVLLAILTPALNVAKDHAKRAVCLAHTHGLGLGWVLYAEDNNGKIVSAKTARIQEVSPGVFRMPAPSAYHDSLSWAGWWDGAPDNKLAHEACITLGALFPYIENIKAYRCPVGDRDQWRTSAIVDSMNGHYEHGGQIWPVVRKVSDMKSPATRMVFLDEGYASTESWTIWPDRLQWWDVIPLRHGEGTTVGMADNSAEYWKWVDDKTVKFGKGEMDAILSAQNNPDFDRVQRAVWTLKHRP